MKARIVHPWEVQIGDRILESGKLREVTGMARWAVRREFTTMHAGRRKLVRVKDSDLIAVVEEES